MSGPDDHIGCMFNHEHRWPECYDDTVTRHPDCTCSVRHELGPCAVHDAFPEPAPKAEEAPS